jgi:predicted metal-dependent HD superfamily phosphohydrolase
MSRTDLSHWLAVWNALGCRGDPSQWHRRLLSAYGEAHRRYHNLKHIDECLLELDDCRHLAEEPHAIEMALWFHDAVYDPQSATNEADSADLATDCLTGSALAPAVIERLRQLILSTKSHRPESSGDEALMIDIDLSILGRPPARFWEYEYGIASEYSWVPSATYAQKRSEILAAFLARPVIFLTPSFQQRYEASARTNLKAAIQRLNARPPNDH